MDRITGGIAVDVVAETSERRQSQDNTGTAAERTGAATVCNVVDVEEGEVEEAEEAVEEMVVASERSLAFEIKFAHKSVFHKYGNNIMSAINAAFNNKEEQERIEFSINETVVDTAEGEPRKESIVCISAYLIAAPDKFTDSEQHKSFNHSEDVFASNISEERDSSLDVDLSSLFTIDTAGSVKLDTVQVPSYKRAIKDVLDEESAQRKRQKQEQEDDMRCKRPRATAACFNCGSASHGLRDCSKPRNANRINRAKKAFVNKQERYHMDIEQRFAHLRPGVISEKLQAALGLRRGELPFFFYRMRVMGYPPGWLEDAKVASSGISLFNSDGNAVQQSDEEEGALQGLNHKYNISKIIDFPGFNADPGPMFYDDYEHHNVPPLNRCQMKNEFIKTLGDNIIKGYKRKKLKNLPSTSSEFEPDNSSGSLEMADMEIEDPDMPTETNVVFTRPLPPPEPAACIEQPPPPPPPKSPPPTINTHIGEDASGNCSHEERSHSPTLADLEAQQQKLLAELQTDISNTIVEPDDSLIDEVLALEDTQSSANVSNSDNVLESAASPTPTSAPATPSASTTHLSVLSTPPSSSSKRSDIIKESHMGTPILKFSAFDKLPAGDNFKVGVSDVINFENLPDSTGKYEHMKVVIKKVRTIITKLQADD